MLFSPVGCIRQKTFPASPFWADEQSVARIGIVYYSHRPDQRPFSLGLPANSPASRRGARQRWSGRYSCRLAFLPLRPALGAAGILLEHLPCLALAFLLYPLPVPVRVLCDCDSECPSINPASKSFC